MRIVQISDTHLSAVKAHFADNWAPLAEWIAAERPDLVIHTGDVTVDGADVEEDLRYAVELMSIWASAISRFPAIMTSATPGTRASR